MKKIKLSLLLLIAGYCATGQQNQFDIVSYNLPKGFTQEKTADRVTVTKDGGSNGFCIITVFKSIDASNDSKKNFDLSWEELVKNILPVSEPAMQPTVTEDGWKTEVGSSSFEKEGISGTAILLSSTQKNKLVNIQVLLNGSDEYINAMTTFLESVKMNDAATNTNTQVSNAATDNKKSTNGKKAKDEITTGPKAEVWVMIRSSATAIVTSQFKYESNYFIVYPNGDYYPRFPLNGLQQLDNTDKQDESWGRFTMKGNKGVFQSKYDKVEVEQVSATLMKRPGYTFQLRKMSSVDGLLLDGEWGPYPDWEKQPHLQKAGYEGTGVRSVVAFKKDGSFTDYGFFVTNLSRPHEAPERVPGKGTYAIKNFTLLLKYDDGRMIYKAFTGAGSINPAVDSKAIYINENPYYKTGFNKTK